MLLVLDLGQDERSPARHRSRAGRDRGEDRESRVTGAAESVLVIDPCGGHGFARGAVEPRIFSIEVCSRTSLSAASTSGSSAGAMKSTYIRY